MSVTHLPPEADTLSMRNSIKSIENVLPRTLR
jgi:hypothetical protein